MPTFDFRCGTCQTVFEKTVPFGTKRLPSCAACGSKTVEKLLTPPLGIHFKGGGFYRTDGAATPDTKKTPPPASPDSAS